MLFILLHWNTIIFCQDREQLNCLNDSLRIAKDDTSRINVLRKIGVLYYINADSNIYYMRQALLLAEKINWTKGIAHVTYSLDLDAADKILQRPAIKDKDNKIIQPLADGLTARKEKEQIIYTGFIAQDVEKTAKNLNYDFSGIDAARKKVLKQINVSGKGNGTITVDAAMLASGAYQYSLVIDEQICESRKILLLK